MRHILRLAAPVMILAAVGMSACQPADDGAMDDSLAAGAADDPMDVGDDSAMGGGTNVTAALSEWSIELASDTINAGPTTFRVTNNGTVAHQFEVEGNGVETETAEIPPGGEATLSVDLTAGTYEVYCPISNDSVDHSERGMTTRLVVR
ncbi:MAG: cupredoxin domain-containing protein [Gemmatimonadaceae bacterium]